LSRPGSAPGANSAAWSVTRPNCRPRAASSDRETKWAACYGGRWKCRRRATPRGLSGLSAPTAIRPPRRVTRLSSPTVRWGSVTNSQRVTATVPSNVASSNGRRWASATISGVRARRAATAGMAGSRPSPVSNSPRCSKAVVNLPLPHPTSRTRRRSRGPTARKRRGAVRPRRRGGPRASRSTCRRRPLPLPAGQAPRMPPAPPGGPQEAQADRAWSVTRRRPVRSLRDVRAESPGTRSKRRSEHSSPAWQSPRPNRTTRRRVGHTRRQSLADQVLRVASVGRQSRSAGRPFQNHELQLPQLTPQPPRYIRGSGTPAILAATFIGRLGNSW